MTLDNTDTPDTTNEETPETPAENTETPVATTDEAPPEEPTEAAAEEAGEEDEEGQSKPEGKKRVRAGGFQRRIERQEREIEFWRQQALARGAQPAAQPGPEETPEQKAAAYIESLVDQRVAAREEQARLAAQQAEFVRRTQEVRALHPDFDEVVMGVEHIPVPPAIQRAILTSSVGPAIMYELAANPAELARISALHPVDAAREIGRLEAKASGSAAPKTAQKPVARKPPPPAPITPVTARGPTTVKDPSKMSYEEYNAWRDSQRKR